MNPTTRSKMGSLNIVKGKMSGALLVAFDLVEDCSDSKCPIYAKCKYEKAGPCSVQAEYIGMVTAKLGKIAAVDSEVDSVRVGMLIVPLFQQLIRLKMEEYCTSVLGGKSGKANPIFKETRETIKTIDQILSKLGGDGRNGGGKRKLRSEELGEDGFYETLFEDAPPERKRFDQRKANRRRVRPPEESVVE